MRDFSESIKGTFIHARNLKFGTCTFLVRSSINLVDRFRKFYFLAISCAENGQKSNPLATIFGSFSPKKKNFENFSTRIVEIHTRKEHSNF